MDFIKEQTLSLLRSYNPIWLLDDLNGKICDDTFYLYTLENTLPYLPQNIWRDSSGVTPWSNPIQFLANGTLPDNMYWNDTLIYRLEIRQNDGSAPPSQADALIYEVNNYIPGTGAQIVPGTALSVTDNQITNPQFQIVNFVNPLSITTAGTFEIAPGWSIITTGAGTLTVTQYQQAGNVYTGTNQSNASTGITLENNGFGTVTLRQRFNGNGALWTGEAVSGGFTASALNGVTLSMNIRYSDVTATNIMNQLLTTANTDYSKAVTIPVSANTDAPDVAWTDIDLSFNINTTVSITSVQIIGESSALEIKYLQTTPERQVDETFNYYNLPLKFKPIPSYLVGWDFPLNPSQFFANGAGAVGAFGANKSSYCWDQTIIFQTVNSSVAVDRHTTSQGLAVTTLLASSFALIQYIPQNIARNILSERSSVQIKASVSSGTLNGTVSLWWTDAALPDIKGPNNNSLVSSISLGIPTCGNGTWNQVKNTIYDGSGVVSNKSSVPFTLNTTSSQIDFTGFSDNSIGANSATNMAIVITFDTMIATGAMYIDYCSLVPGNIPTRPAPQTLDEVLRECTYYYEQTYLSAVDYGTSTVSGALELIMSSVSPNATSRYSFASPFGIVFNTPKIFTPRLSIYSTAGSLGYVNSKLFYEKNTAAFNTITNDVAYADYWNVTISTKSALFLPKIITELSSATDANSSSTFISAGISFQYSADSRLGT